MRIPMGLSTYSTVSLEDVRREGGQNPYAFQLSIVKDRQMSLNWIKRAEGRCLPLNLREIVTADLTWTIAAGYKALFITVDAPVLARRLNEKSGVRFELPQNMSLPNLSDPIDTNKPGSEKTAVVRSYKYSGRDASNSWQSVIPWVKANTKLEIWLKGSKQKANAGGSGW